MPGSETRPGCFDSFACALGSRLPLGICYISPMAESPFFPDFEDVTPGLREGSEIVDSVYQQLRRLASSYLRRERRDHTLQPTALVHEAYLRLAEQDSVIWQSREHFV